MRAKKKRDLGEQCIYIYTKPPPPPTLKNTISRRLRGKEVIYLATNKPKVRELC